MVKESRGLRNNNPGNIRKSKTKWIGEVDSNDTDFKKFKSIEYGYRAMIKLLRNYYILHGCRTVSDFIKRWAPPSENNTNSYILTVCRQLQVEDNCKIDINDKGSMCALSSAISFVENGKKANIKDVEKGWELL